MGGANAGEVASQLALETIGEMQRTGTGTLDDEVREANRVVFERAGEDTKLAGMGTTVTAALASAEALHLAHVGDSRAYLRRAGSLRKLTNDHTLVDRMVQAGEISRDEADVHPHRNVLIRALGTEPKVDVEAMDLGLLEGDRGPDLLRRAHRHGHREPDHGDLGHRAGRAAGCGGPAGARREPRRRDRQHHGDRARGPARRAGGGHRCAGARRDRVDGPQGPVAGDRPSCSRRSSC